MKRLLKNIIKKRKLRFLKRIRKTATGISMFISALPWIATVLGIFFFVLLFMLLFTSNSHKCSQPSTGPIQANFKITPVGSNAKVSVAAEKFLASKHMDAAQAAAVLGSAQQESTMGNAKANLLGWSNAAGTTADDSHDTSNVGLFLKRFFDHFNKTENGSITKFIKDMKGKTPTEDEEYWGHHVEVCGVMGHRVQFANQFYKKITGGHSTVSSDSDATASDSSSSCGSSDDTDTSSLIKFAEKYMGLPYGQSSRFQSIKDILAEKPKSDTAANDCDGFAYAVLKKCGYKVPSQYWGDVGGEDSYYSKYKIPKSQIKAGTPGTYPPGAPDYGKLGHAFFFLEKWHGGNTKILGEGPGKVRISTLNWEFTGGDINDVHAYNVPKG